MNWYKLSKLSAREIPSLKVLRQFCSDEECYEVASLISRKFPQLQTDAGFYIKKDGVAADHGWTKAANGTIVDVTHSQFDSSVPVMIAKPGTPEHNRYVSWDEHHNPDCLHQKLNLNEPCQVCGWPNQPHKDSQ